MTIVMCPSRRRAMYEFGRFLYKNEPFIESANRRNLTVKLTNGCEYRFESEQCSTEKLKGLHSDYMFIDGFNKEQTKNREV